jgi:hypothetical protein
MQNWWEADSVVKPVTGSGAAAPTIGTPLIRTPEKAPSPSDIRTTATLPYDVRKAEADAAKAETDAAAAARKAEEDAKKREGKDIDLAGSELINALRAAQEAKRISKDGWFATGFGSEATSSIGATPSADVRGLLNTVGAKAAFDRLQRMREESPTGGALGGIAVKELELLRDSVASLDPNQSDTQFQSQMDQIIASYSDLYRKLGADPKKLDEVLGVIPKTKEEESAAVLNPTDGQPASGTPLDADAGPVEMTTAPIRYATEKDKRYATLLQTLLDRGAGVKEAQELAEDYGYPNGIKQAEWERAVNYNKRRAKNAPPARVAIPESGQREISDARQFLSELAGSTYGGFATGVANAVTPGLVDEIGGGLDSLVTGKPMDQAIAEANLSKSLIQEASPNAYMGGEITGGVGTLIGAGAAGAGVKGLSALASRYPGATAIAGDAAYGAAYGAGEDNESRLSSGIMGAGAGIAGGVAGRGLANVASGMIAPRVSEGIRTLRDKGVRTSVGQSIGPKAAAFEEKMLSVPILGDLVRGGRERALDDFNRVVVDDALAPIGKSLPEGASGTAAMKFAQKAFDDAYADARAAMQLKPDIEMVTGLRKIEASVTNGGLDEESAKRLRKIYDAQVARRLKPGGVSGDDYKKMTSGLGKLAASTRRSNPELSSAIRDMQTVIDDAARRASPPEAVAALDAADEGYSLFVRAEQAAGSRGGETGSFTPAQYDSAIQRADGSIRSKAYLRGEAKGQDLAEAGKTVLRDRIPNSGTADRAMAGAGVLGAGALDPTGLSIAATGGLAAAYSPGIRDALASMFARKASPKAERIAEEIRKRKRLSGAATAPLAIGYAGGE